MEETPLKAVSYELSSILDGLASEGTLDSTGIFTVDLAKALPKLEKFQLPKPHFGLLKIIQSGVVAGATRISTSFTAAHIRIEHNGIPPTPSQLKSILSYLMAPDHPTEERALRDLAIGINTTLARGASWVELKVQDGERWASQRWLSRQEVEEKKEAPAASKGMTCCFTMRRTFGQAASQAFSVANKDVGDLVFRRRDSLDEDAQAVYDSCRHAPVEILLGGRRLPPSIFGRRVLRKWSPFTWREHRKSNLMDIFLSCRDRSPHLLSPPTGSDARFKYFVPGQFVDGRWKQIGKPEPLQDLSVLERRCFGVFGIRGVPSVPGSVTLVKDGVDLTTLAPPVLPRGVTSVLTAEGLPLDLSHFRIVAGPAIEERLDWLSTTLGGIVKAVTAHSHFQDCSPEQSEHLDMLARL
ncbi:MAG: hypothetical protein WC314_11120 [Vulcanimicrobiota bacterium]